MHSLEDDLVYNSTVCIQVPTFLFYRGGKATGRHVGSSRADLIGQILQQQNAYGVRPPTTGQGVQTRRRKIERRV